MNWRKWIIDALLLDLWNSIFFTPPAFLLWRFTWEQWLLWMITGTPLTLLLGRPIVYLIIKTRKLLGVKED